MSGYCAACRRWYGNLRQDTNAPNGRYYCDLCVDARGDY